MNSDFEMKKEERLQTLFLDLALRLTLFFLSTPGTRQQKGIREAS